MNKTMKDNVLSAEAFDPRENAYPFECGSVAIGVNVSPSGVSFLGQRGPIKEVGVNGCQIDDMIEFARRTIEVFNKKFPCRENSRAITKLQEAEMWLRERTRNREARGVEGTNQK